MRLPPPSPSARAVASGPEVLPIRPHDTLLEHEIGIRPPFPDALHHRKASLRCWVKIRPFNSPDGDSSSVLVDRLRAFLVDFGSEGVDLDPLVGHHPAGGQGSRRSNRGA